MQLELIFDELGDFVRSYRGRISTEGMVILCGEELPAGSVVELTVALSDGLELVRGQAGVLASRVVSLGASEAHGVVVRFVQLHDDGAALIRRLEERHQNEGKNPFHLGETLKLWRSGDEIGDFSDSGIPLAALKDSLPSAPPVRDATPESQHDQVEDELFTALPTVDLDHSSPPPQRSYVDSARLRPEPPPRRRLPRGLGIAALALMTAVAVTTGAVLFFPDLLGLRQSRAEPPNKAQRALSQPTPGAATTLTSPANPDLAPSVAEPTNNPNELTTRTPAVQLPPSPAPTARAQGDFEVMSLSWEEHESDSIVSIECSKPPATGQLVHFPISDQAGPRYVLQISGVTHSQLPINIQVDGMRIAAIRSWHHTEKQPAELHIVVDLSTPEVRRESLRVDGSRILLRLVSHTERSPDSVE